MQVINRKGKLESIDVKKIQDRINYSINNPFPLKCLDSGELAIMVIAGIKNNMTTSEIDLYTSEVAYSLSTKNIEYMELSSRIMINNHHKNTVNTFSEKIEILYNNVNPNGIKSPIIYKDFYEYVMENKDFIDSIIDYSRDYKFDMFGFKTLEKTYLLKLSDGTVIERPQDMFMRVAIQIHYYIDIRNKGHLISRHNKFNMANLLRSMVDKNMILEKIKRVYDNLSNMMYVHATPTLFNSGTVNCSCSSCFLLGTEDSINGINKSLSDCGIISKSGGGIGIHISNLRSKDSYINGTHGRSNGIIPFMRLFNEIGRAYNQGGKRNGSIAIYLEPHHADLMNFLNVKKTQGDENLKCKDLFTALWISDLFMERLEKQGMWSVFDPDECKKLNEVYGDEYRELYLKYENEGRAKAQYKITDIIYSIYESQIEKGVPYILFKDTANKYSMQKNIGIIKSSNLCTEIMLVSDSNNYSVCNLASICLSQFVYDDVSGTDRIPNNEFPLNPVFDFKHLIEIVHEIVDNLNNVIEKTLNPTFETYNSNFDNRPIGIGVQGLNDVFMKFRFPFTSDKAQELNKKIAETIYYAALEKSCMMAKDFREDYEHLDNILDKIYVECKNIEDYNNYMSNYYFKSNIYEKVSIVFYTRNNKFFKNILLIKSNFNSRILDDNIKYSDKFPFMEINKKYVGAYPNYIINDVFAPISKKFHWELYGVDRSELLCNYNWEELRKNINEYGVKNSTLVAYMPTASTSQIMGNTPSFEPYMTNLYKRKTLAGVYTVINKYLVNDLRKVNLWSDKVKDFILENDGSVQNIIGFPNSYKELYKTVWEIKQKDLIKLAADRQPFVDQSQSLNIYLDKYNPSICASIIKMTWKLRLKTGMYYTKIKPTIDAQKFTVSYGSGKNLILDEQAFEKKEAICDEEICLVCSS